MPFNKNLQHLNRAIHLEHDASFDPTKDLMTWKVIKQLELALKNSKNADFVVFDYLLREKALAHLTSLLQKSTIWYDLTNGEVFASHSDDGLFFHSIAHLCQVNVLFVDLSTRNSFFLSKLHWRLFRL